MSFLAALLSPPLLFKSSSKPILPSFICTILLIGELGKHFGGTSRGARGSRTQDAWATGLCSAPCRSPEGGKASVAQEPTGELAAADTSIPPTRTKLKREILSGVHLGLGPRAGGVLPQGGSPGPQVALPIQTNMQCHYGGSCCSRPRGCFGTAGAPHPIWRGKRKRGLGAGAPLGAA